MDAESGFWRRGNGEPVLEVERCTREWFVNFQYVPIKNPHTGKLSYVARVSEKASLGYPLADKALEQHGIAQVVTGSKGGEQTAWNIPIQHWLPWTKILHEARWKQAYNSSQKEGQGTSL